MKQGETISAVMGSGAATIKEYSNNPAVKTPGLILMRPAEFGVVVNGGCTDQAVINTPAESFRIFDKEIRSLYEFLRDYYEGK